MCVYTREVFLLAINVWERFSERDRELGRAYWIESVDHHLVVHSVHA
jgi:hypothetical protein